MAVYQKAAFKDICIYDGWAKVEEHKPPRFELVKVRDEKGKIQYGWWNGHEWDFGYRRVGEPLFWRNVKEYVLCQ